jgi:pyruvate dehydrogenase E2 component (dihydrolipoamide acetyltransferase)
MSVSVSMPQLGESVTEGTVTRWLKKEGERVEVDEPLLEVSTDKVDTEIPSPASGILRGIAVDEDETVAVGAQLAVIEDSETSETSEAAPADDSPPQDAAEPEPAAPDEPASADAASASASDSDGRSPQVNYAPPAEPAQPAPPPASGSPDQVPAYAPPPAYGQPSPAYASYGQPAPQAGPADGQAHAPSEPAASSPAAAAPTEEEYPPPTPLPSAGEAPYVTPLVRKLAAEHAVNLETVSGTGVGGRIRKQDVIEAARAQRGAQPQNAQPQNAQPQNAQPQNAQAQSAQPQNAQAQSAPSPQSAQPPAPAPSSQAQQAPVAQQAQGTQAPQELRQPQPAPAAPQQPAARADAPARPTVVPSSLRGTTQRMSRPRQVIAQRMVESLHTSAQLTTVVEADVTAIARLRGLAKRDFEAREGVKLSFLPFFALAAVEALKVHPKLNAVIDGDQVTYLDAEHVGIAVDTERGLMVPVIHNAGDLNIGGLARKIGDLAERTRSGHVGPDELAGGTFTLTNTGSRGALFDTPIINQPQVAILGTGTVVKRPVVVEDPALGEVIAVRSMVYLALTYDHRLVDGADAARFLTTVKNRLEEGAFEAELGL